MKRELSSEHALNTILAENTSKAQRLKNNVFHPVPMLPTQIGLDGLRNSEPKFSCLGPFNTEKMG
jgi:hypothetical protein